MSRLINSVSDHLNLSTPYPTAPPFTLHCWAKHTSSGVVAYAVSLDTGGSNDRHSLTIDSSEQVNATSRDTVQSQGIATLASTQNVWGAWTGVWAATNDRRAYFNGTNRGDSVVTRTPATPTGITVGIKPGNTLPLLGYLAHVAIWDIALSDAEVLALGTGTDPRAVQPANLAHYWTLTGNQSPEPDSGFRGESLTVTGTTYSTDDPPPLDYPQGEVGVIINVIRGIAG